MDVPCKKTDKIKCTNDGCGKISLVSELKPKEGNVGEYHYGYCPHCSDVFAKVFYRSKNAEPVLVANVELVESESEQLV